MDRSILERMWDLIGLRYKSHPWHGVQIGEQAPDLITAFIEMVPTDTVKYEIDKTTGYLKVDRPQKFSKYSACSLWVYSANLLQQGSCSLLSRANGKREYRGRQGSS